MIVQILFVITNYYAYFIGATFESVTIRQVNNSGSENKYQVTWVLKVGDYLQEIPYHYCEI